MWHLKVVWWGLFPAISGSCYASECQRQRIRDVLNVLYPAWRRELAHIPKSCLHCLLRTFVVGVESDDSEGDADGHYCLVGLMQAIQEMRSKRSACAQAPYNNLKYQSLLESRAGEAVIAVDLCNSEFRSKPTTQFYRESNQH